MCQFVTEYFGCCCTTVSEIRYEPCCPNGCRNAVEVDIYNMEECSTCEAVREKMEAREREAEEAEHGGMDGEEAKRTWEEGEVEKMMGTLRVSEGGEGDAEGGA